MADTNKPFLPISRPSLGDDEINEVVDSLRSGWITTGPKVQKFEEALKAYVGSKEMVAIASATAGLHVALLALDLKPEDEVITTPMTFAATLNTIMLAGAKPVLVDIDPDTLQIRPELVASAITSRTRVLMPVHFAGQPVDLDALRALARNHGLRMLEDAAHAIGTEYQGEKIGARADIAVFSFHPMKNITTGEGGAIATSDAALAERTRLLRFHGITKDAWKRYSSSGTPRYQVMLPGLKYNMMDIQAALGIHQLKKLDRFIERRTALAHRYHELLEGIPGVRPFAAVRYPHRHAWHLYIIRVDQAKAGLSRDQLIGALAEDGIGTGLHYEAAHLHPYYREHLNLAGKLPAAELCSEQILSIPFFPDMTEEDQQRVAESIKSHVARARGRTG
ncbi:MAG: aminotransferase class V-fold PLP-dependent enzyme [Planctomycetota bacterium]